MPGLAMLFITSPSAASPLRIMSTTLTSGAMSERITTSGWASRNDASAFGTIDMAGGAEAATRMMPVRPKRMSVVCRFKAPSPEKILSHSG
ncbi:hypothetical protein D3C87_2007720 [compost metagenome]